MPIKVQCACGAAFAAKDELAGRTVKCPKCQQPLTIPAAAVPVAAAGAAQPAPQPGGDLFAEAGLHAPQAGTVPCPGCATPMPMNAVVCIKCGYNKRMGRRMDVVKQTGGQEIPGGHSATVEEMLSKAAQRIEEDKEEERKKTAEGMPWWAYLIALVAVLGFMVAMMFVPQGMGLLVGGMALIVLSALVQFYAWLRGLIGAFMNHPLHGLAIFFGDILVSAVLVAMIVFEVPIADYLARYLGVPLCWAGYIFAHWDTLGYWWNLFLMAVIMRWGGLLMLLAALFIVPPADAMVVPQVPPPAVVSEVEVREYTRPNDLSLFLKRRPFDDSTNWPGTGSAEGLLVCGRAVRNDSECATAATSRGCFGTPQLAV